VGNLSVRKLLSKLSLALPSRHTLHIKPYKNIQYSKVNMFLLTTPHNYFLSLPLHKQARKSAGRPQVVADRRQTAKAAQEGVSVSVSL
jgi:hypothetical protein